MLETFAELERARARLVRARRHRAGARARLRRTVDMRYAGQNYELPVALPDEPSRRRAARR